MALFEQYPLSVFNTIHREKEVFTPIKSPFVGMYKCGPTVYGEPHLGHARSDVSFDIVFRYLKYLGYKVRYVRNITDVGHLENDADEGEDKVAKKARLEQLEPMEVVQFYTLKYHDCMRALNTLPPSIEPSASGHIIEQIEIIEKILERGFAYEADGSVYFDTKKFAESGEYGKLSGKKVEDLLEGSRTNLEGQSEKRSSLDFALWKNAKPEHIMRWPSPWGIGFPGWHLECTAMSSKYLGVPFDIHAGGMDLQFPHHEGEIAQSHGAFGCAPANYWLHNNMLTINGQKMGKSLGNFITLQQMFAGDHPLLEQAYHPQIIRFFMLMAHYRSSLDFSNSALQAAEKGFNRLMKAKASIEGMEYKAGTVDSAKETEIKDTIAQVMQHMSDDFNTARAIASMFELASAINIMQADKKQIGTISEETFSQLQNFYPQFIEEVLGLQPIEEGESDILNTVMQLVLELRTGAKTEKNYAVADHIRNSLKDMGINIMDGKEGTTWEKE